MNAPDPRTVVKHHLVPPPPHIPPAPFETQRFLIVQAAHAWRATPRPALRRPGQRLREIGLVALLTLSGLCTLALVWGLRA